MEGWYFVEFFPPIAYTSAYVNFVGIFVFFLLLSFLFCGHIIVVVVVVIVVV